MIPYKRILIYDAGAINKLADDPDSGVLISKIKRTFRVRLTSSNFEEIFAAPTAARRHQLTAVCHQLLSVGECILPFHEIIVALSTKFKTHPGFNWRRVSIQFPEAAAAIRNSFSISDQFAKQQHREMQNHGAGFLSVFKNAKPHFDELRKQGEVMPRDLPELVRRLQINPGAYWALGMDFYHRATGSQITEDEVRKLIESCPPFKALILAVCMAEFEYCIRDLRTEISYRAGRVDLCSAVYLPYTDLFVTAEKKQRQENALKEIVRTGKFGIPVLSYDKFRFDLLNPFAAHKPVSTSNQSTSAVELI